MKQHIFLLISWHDLELYMQDRWLIHPWYEYVTTTFSKLSLIYQLCHLFYTVLRHRHEASYP